MRTVSQDFIDASLSPGTYATGYIEIGSTVIGASDIVDITINEDIGEGGAFTIGTFNTTEVSITLLSEAVPNAVAGLPIKIYLGYSTAQGFEYVPMGVFYAEPRDISHKNLLTTIKAHDGSWAMTNAYTTSLDFTSTVYVSDVLSEIQTALSLTFGTYGGLNPQYVVVYEAPEGSYRDVIAQMAMLMGTNAKLNRTGALDFIKVNPSATPVQDYGAYDYSSQDYELTSNEPFAIGNLTVNYTHEVTSGGESAEVTDTFVYTTTGSHGITLDTQNVRTQLETNGLGQNVLGSGFSYYGYSITLPGQPQIDLGDVITVTEPLGDEYDFIVLSAAHNFNGAMKTTFSAVVNDSDPKVDGENISGSLTETVAEVKTTVSSIGRIAGHTNQYFWHTSTGTDTGAHITEVPQEDFIANPSQGGGNLLARSNGIAVRDGLTDLATFGSSSAQIGASSSGHVLIDINSVDIMSGSTQRATFGATSVIGTSSTGVTVSSDGLVVNKNNVPHFKVTSNTTNYNDVQYDVRTPSSVPQTSAIIETATIPYESGIPYYCSAYDESDLINIGDIPLVANRTNEPFAYDYSGDTINFYMYSNATLYTYKMVSFTVGISVAYATAGAQIGYYPDDLSDGSVLKVGIGATDAYGGNKTALKVKYNGETRIKGDVYVGCEDDGTGGTKLAKDVITTSSFTGNAIAFDTGTTWKDISSTTYPNNATVSIADAGIYLLIGNVAFSSNSSGRRGIRWYDITGSTAIIRSQQVFAPANGAIAYQQTICVVETNGTASYTLQAYQNSGSQLNVTPYVNIVRLK